MVPDTWKNWETRGSYPNTDTIPQKTIWTQRERKTQSTREYRIPKQILQTIWLDWHTCNRNREASNWRYPCRLSWHFRQTQNGYWDQHGIQNETNSERQQSCLQPKSVNADPLERTLNCWISSDAQKGNLHGSAFLQVHKSYIFTGEGQQKVPCPCGTQENQEVWLRKTILTIIIQLANCQIQRNNWQESPYSVTQPALRLLTVCRWRINGQWKSLRSISLAELLPTKDMHKILTDRVSAFSCFMPECLDAFVKADHVLTTWTKLESQPVMLRNLPGTFRQSSSAFAKQNWNWQLINATSGSQTLISCEEQFHQKESHHNLRKFTTS